MTATLMRDINLTATQPANLTDVNGTAFYTGGPFGPALYTDAADAPIHAFPETSTLGNFTPAGSELFFTVEDSGGRTLWGSDGTSAGTFALKDITPGQHEWDSVEMRGIGSTLYFSAADGTSGTKLWKSDGTVAGTVAVKDVLPEIDSLPHNLTAVGQSLYFVTLDGSNGQDLWKSDGTSEGTTLVKDMNSETGGPALRYFTPVGSDLFFATYDATQVQRLWKTDGTTEGTTEVGPNGELVWSLNAADTNLYYLRRTGSHSELWKTDGTGEGTVKLLDLPYHPTVGHVTADGSGLYFTYDDGAHGEELWHSDGTAEGTRIVADLNDGTESSAPRNLSMVGSTLYFTATDASNVTHLYRTDGTADGTTPLTVLHNLDSGYIAPNNGDTLIHAVFDGALYFVDNDPTYGRELFRTDGTTTGIVKDLAPGTDGIYPRELTVVGGHLDFVGNDGKISASVYRTDGTDAGTAEVNTFSHLTNTYYHVVTQDSLTEFSRLGMLGDVAIFLADDGIHGAELWRSDGTAAGTAMIADLNPNGGIRPSDPVVLNGSLYFGLGGDATSGLSGLWRTDGTAAGTTLVKRFASSDVYDRFAPRLLTVFNGQLFFAAGDGSSDVDLWKSDGTSEGTTLVKDIGDGMAASFASELAVVGSSLFFTTRGYGPVGLTEQGLWKTDGTPGGTVEVKHFSLPAGRYDLPRRLTAVGDMLYFIADDGAAGDALWKSDGTLAGTVIVKDVAPRVAGQQIWSLEELTAVGSTLFFTNEAPNDAELWTSDGTAEGTVMLKHLDASRRPSLAPPFLLRNLTALNGTTLLFTAIDGVHGNELWRSDGTAEGTVLVMDVNPGPADGFDPGFHAQNQLQLINGVVYFVAGNGLAGNGLYRTDGTEAGTLRLASDGIKFDGSQPAILAVLPGGLLVAADDLSGTGLEPHLLDNAIANHPPAFNPVADQTVRAGHSLTFPLTATDPDPGETFYLRYSLVDEAPGSDFTASIDQGTGVVTFTASHVGTYQFHVQVSDVGWPSRSAVTTVTVHVIGAAVNDFDGDGTSDYAVYRPSQGIWVVRQSGGGSVVTAMGDPSAGDVAAPGDYDGDGTTDFAVFRPGTGQWIIRKSGGGVLVTSMGDPSQGDLAAPGDYDGDGITDFAVYRPSQALWIVRQSTGGTILTTMGDPAAGDLAAPGDFDGDGKTDFAVYRPAAGLWIVRQSSGGSVAVKIGQLNGSPEMGAIAAPGDFDGDGKTDFVVYDPLLGSWENTGGLVTTRMGDSAAGDVPANTSPYYQIQWPSSPPRSITPATLVPQPSRVTTAYRLS